MLRITVRMSPAHEPARDLCARPLRMSSAHALCAWLLRMPSAH